MTALAVMLKSYRGDAAYARRLITSFDQNNTDALPLYVVVPAEDVTLFEDFGGATATVLSEQELGRHLVRDEVHGLRPGYVNQEILKLAFAELELADNYFCLDSDAEFIRPFTRSDFMVDATVPFQVLVEDRDLLVDPAYYAQYWQSRQASFERIARELGLDDRVILTCHGHQVFSSIVLASFREEFLAPRNWSYADALAVAPYEFSWYNLWLQKSGAIPIHPREPWVKVFHSEGHHLEAILRGITVTDLARAYIAIVVNSNFSRDLGLLDLRAAKPAALAPYLSYHELASVLGAKIADTWQRRVRRSASPS